MTSGRKEEENEMSEKKKATVEEKGDAILDQEIFVEIEGIRYKMNRLSLRTMLKLAKILSVGAAMMGTNIQEAEISPQLLATMLIGGVMNAETQIMELLAHLLMREDENGNWIELNRKDLEDPDRFPMSSIFPIAEGLVENKDIKSFFAGFTAFMKKPAMKRLLGKASTSSNTATAGQTK